MKNFKLYIIAAFILMANMSFAQDDSTNTKTNATPPPSSSNDYQKVRLGIYGDFGFSYLKPKSNLYESMGTRGSYAYGLAVDINFTRNYTFTTGVKFASYGGKLKFNDTLRVDGNLENGVMDRKYRVNYLEIPLSLKMKTNQMGYLTPFVQVGLHNGFRLSADTDDDFNYGSNSTVSTEGNDNVDGTSFYRLSLEFSLGAEYEISQSFSAFAMLSFHNGLTNSLTDENLNGKESAMFKKFALTVGFMF